MQTGNVLGYTRLWFGYMYVHHVTIHNRTGVYYGAIWSYRWSWGYLLVFSTGKPIVGSLVVQEQKLNGSDLITRRFAILYRFLDRKILLPKPINGNIICYLLLFMPRQAKDKLGGCYFTTSSVSHKPYYCGIYVCLSSIIQQALYKLPHL